MRKEKKHLGADAAEVDNDTSVAADPRQETHTPGPWRVAGEGGNRHIIQTSHLTRDVWSIPRNEADLRLIAAAPDLLAAAKLIASFAVSWQPLTPGDIVELTNAIAKAEGRS